MKPNNIGRSITAVTFAFTVQALQSAETIQPEPSTTSLEPLVVSALRMPQPASTVTSAITVLEPQELYKEGIVQLRDALNASPGVISTSTSGGIGSLGSLFIRGTTTNYSQIVIDGMRLSDSSSPLGNLLGVSRTYDIGRIEVLRGPQGAVYGGESVGGVLWMETPRGHGTPSGSATFEAGSFNSFSGYGMFQGEVDKLSYYLTGGYEETDNDGSAGQFHQGSVAIRAEAAINDCWTLGTTFRGVDSYYENAYIDFTGNPATSDDRLDAGLATLYATGKISDVWTARFHAGYRQESYDSDSVSGNYGTDVQAFSLSTDHEVTLHENLRLLTGIFYHNSSYKNTIGTDEDRDRYGAHAVLEWDIIDALTTTAALRWEDYDAYGDELTWRLGSIYRIAATGTNLRGGVGTSFRSPTYLDLFGSSFGAGNPDLDAENALGWDIGVSQEICGTHFAELTWFNNRITDRIQSFPTPPVNISGDSTSQGLELGMRGSWFKNELSYRLAWTYLNKSLADQPRNSATAALNWKPIDKALVGIGATYLSSHSWGGSPLDSYVIARIHGSYQITESLRFHARIENALDENYELANFSGTPVQGPGAGIYAGITIDW